MLLTSFKPRNTEESCVFSFFAILPKSLLNEFKEELQKTEVKFNALRIGIAQSSGNRFGMRGDTYTFSYSKSAGINAFKKSLPKFWAEFNAKHPGTRWTGK